MKKFKKIIFLACFVMLIAVMAIAVSASSAYDTTRTVEVDLSLKGLEGITTYTPVGESDPVSVPDTRKVTLPLYKDNKDGTFDALTWYVDSTGTNLVSTPTKDIMYLDNKYLKFTTDGKNIRANIVVFNVQDDTIDGWRSTNEWGGVGNAGIQTSAYLQYIYFGDKTTVFYETNTFKECTNLKGVYFTANSELNDIKDRTFAGCSSLTKVTLPPKLKTMGSAFRETGLTTISIPASVTSLSMTFYECKSLKEVVFAEGSYLSTEIKAQTFYNCTSLESINIPNGVKIIGKQAFSGCGKLTDINIPDSVTELGELAFNKCGLTAVTIPSSITTMGKQVFMGCTSLESVVFAEGSSLTGTETFSGCTSLISVNIPNSITEIGASAFVGCKFTSINDPSDVNTVNIPDSVTIIGSLAFDVCKSLKSVTLPNKVTTIGDRAFRNCSALEYINFGASLKAFGVDTSNKSYVLYGCSKLKTVIMPATIELVGTEIGVFRNGTGSIKFFFTGTEAEVTALKAKLTASENTKFTNATLKKYDATEKGSYDTAYDYYNSLSGAYIIYDYNKCEAFYSGKHIESDAVLAYADGFDKSGTSTCTCTRECGYSKSTAIDPIFTALGYSTKNDGTAIYAGFTVNKTALDNYNAYITAQGENALRYGIVIVNMGTSVADGTNLAFTSAGVVDSTKAIQVEINDTNFARFGFTLTGFGDDTKGLNLVISAYVIESKTTKTEEETVTTTVKNVSFVQQEAKNVDGTGIDGYYTAMVIANSSETKKLGTMTLTRLLALTGKGVVTEDTITTGTTNNESSGS